MRHALTSLLLCAATLTACDPAGPSPEPGQPNPDLAGKADGTAPVEVVETDEALQSTAFKRMLCAAIIPAYGWDTAAQRDAFEDGCTDHRFTVTEMTRSTLYLHADDGDPITLEMRVRVEFEGLTFQTSLVREFADHEFDWTAKVDGVPDGLDRDALIQDIADEMGEYFNPDESPERFDALRFDTLPEGVQVTARERESHLDEALRREWHDNGAGISDEGAHAILHEGQVIGYTVSIEYWIEDSLFDGGGTTLYLNTLGDVIEEVEWWG